MRSERATRAGIVAVALAVLASPAATPAQDVTVIDRTVAFVARQPVLLSDVRLEMALMDVAEPRAVENVIDQFLMFEDASRLATAAPNRADVAEAVADLRTRAGPAWSEAALRRVAARQLVILDYVRQRLQPLVRVDDAAVRQAWEERTRDESNPVPFEQAAPALRVALERAAIDVRIEEWVRAARERAEIRRVP